MHRRICDLDLTICQQNVIFEAHISSTCSVQFISLILRFKSKWEFSVYFVPANVKQGELTHPTNLSMTNERFMKKAHYVIKRPPKYNVIKHPLQYQIPTFDY